MLAIKFLLLVFSVLFGYTIGYIFTETKYRLSRYDVFKMKVWECRKCLSTHIAWVTSTFISLLFSDWIMLVIGLVFAGFLFLGLYIDQKNKTMTVEEFDELNNYETSDCDEILVDDDGFKLVKK